MIFADTFRYKTSMKNLESAPSVEEEKTVEKSVVGFVHLEEADQDRKGYIVTKLIKNLKWLARKNGTKKVVLHSFAHLSESKAPPEFVKEVLEEAKERLEKAGYETIVTPFGYFLNLEIKAPGHPLARVFKEF